VTLEKFKNACTLTSLKETEKVCHLAFFYLKTKNVQAFGVADAAQWLVQTGGAAPNQHRLANNLRACRNTVKDDRGWRLSGKFIETLEANYPTLSEKSQEVLDDGTILPPSLYDKTRGFVESIAKQINSNYEHNTFDGCAVLMRRMEEVLLITSYEHLGIELEIKDANGNYQMLESIVRNASNNPKLNLSRNSKKSIDVFRELGNYSAHKIFYLCKREYIREKIDEYRALVEELLHKAGLR
jgi:hypothetical protein